MWKKLYEVLENQLLRFERRLPPAGRDEDNDETN
jgi:hypothetical protein